MIKRYDFERLNENECKAIALCSVEHKGYKAYIGKCDNGTMEELNCNVYYNGKLIEYLTYPDYVWRVEGLENYKEKVLKELQEHVFDDSELTTFETYEEYYNKRHYVFNTIPQKFDSISVFGEHTEEEKQSHQVYGGLNWFTTEQDKEYCNNAVKVISKAYREKMNNDENFFKDACISEMFNHESPIDWDGYTPALEALGIDYKRLDTRHKQLVNEAYKHVCRAIEW